MKRKTWNAVRAWLLTVVMVVSVLFGLGVEKPAKAASKMSVSYMVHVQTYGDRQEYVKDGADAGTQGQGKRLEEISIKLTGNEYSGNIEYRTHVQSYGWQDWVINGAKSGTRGQGKRLEAIQIMLTGEIAEHYDVSYQVHCQTYGWMPWVKNGVMAGTCGEAKRLEAIRIKLVPKTQLVDMGIRYRTHVQTHGWQAWKQNGQASGTTGESKRLEGIQIQLTGNRYTGGILYRTHVQSYGWEDDIAENGSLSGTVGQAKRLEAIQIALYGEVADYYDVYYRVHAQSYGWLGWTKNGDPAGTSGLSKRLEAIEIVLVPSGSNPDKYNNSGKASYIQGTNSVEQKIVDLCNLNRQANGVNNNLTLDPVLTMAANIRAKEITQSFSHTRPNGQSCFTVLQEVGYYYTTVGENIAAGQRSAEEVMDDWMNSSGHRRNILNKSFRKIGVGYYVDPNTPYRYYWVQLFSN